MRLLLLGVSGVIDPIFLIGANKRLGLSHATLLHYD